MSRCCLIFANVTIPKLRHDGFKSSGISMILQELTGSPRTHILPLQHLYQQLLWYGCFYFEVVRKLVLKHGKLLAIRCKYWYNKPIH